MKPYDAKPGDYVTPNTDMSTLTMGKSYKVESLDRDGDIRVIDDEGHLITKYARYFDPVTSSLVYWNGQSFEVDGKVTIDSDIAMKKIERFLYPIESFYMDGHREFYILKDVNHSKMIPVELCTHAPPTVTVKLNDSYDAVIHKDVVKVGCQEIPIAKVKEILDEHAKLF
jgi:hypothetical protein